MSLIQQLIDASDLVLYQDYRAGHSQDLSGNSNAGTLSGTTWSSNGIQLAGTDKITVADSAELQLTEGTLVLLGEFHSDPTGSVEERIIQKMDAGGMNWDCYIDSTPAVSFDYGGSVYPMGGSITGKRYIAVNFKDNNTPELFLDGVLAATSGGATYPTVNDAPVVIGNDYSGTSPLRSPLQAALIVNRELTAAEHVELYSELMSMKWPRKSHGKAQGHYGVEELTNGDMEIGDPPTGWAAGNSATLSAQPGSATSGSQVLRVAYGGQNAPYASQTVLTNGVKYRATGWARGDGTGYPRVWGGSVEWNGTTSTAWQYFDLVFEAGSTFFLLYAIINEAGYCEFDNVSVKEVLIDRTQFKTDWNAQVSETAIGSRQQIENTPFYRWSGTWEVETDTIDGETCKVLTCKNAGVVYIDTQLLPGDSTQDAYGTWECWFYKAVNSYPGIVFAASSGAARNDAGQYGYVLYSTNVERFYLGKITAGGMATLHYVDGVLVETTWQKLRVTRRRSDGQFTVYVDDVLYTPLSGTNPTTDNTYTIANYIVLDLDIGDKFAISDKNGDHCLRKLQGVN